MPNRFTQSAQRALNQSMYDARMLGHTYIGSEHLLLGLLSEHESVAAKLLASRAIVYDSIRKLAAELSGTGERTAVGPGDMTPRTKKIIETSALEALQLGSHTIGTEHLLLALLEESDCIAVRLLQSQNISLRELRGEIIAFCRKNNPSEKLQGKTDDAVASSSPSSANSSLAMLPTLRQYGRDMTAQAKEGRLDPIIGRQKETERVIQILSRRSKNNPCLIGEPGVGKTAVAEGLAQRIAEGDVPETLSGKILVSLDLSSMIAGAKYRGEFEDRMKHVMTEIARNPGVILFIDEIHTLIGAGAAEGAVDAANILKPALARGELQVIGATTIEEYRKHIEKDAALERRFQSVLIGEPSPDETLLILRGLREKYEAHHKVDITDEALEASVRYAVRYIRDRYLPDKAIDLIDEAASRLRIAACTTPPEIKELENRRRTFTAEKEKAIRNQEFERAAALRDEEKKAEEQWQIARNHWQERRTEGKLSVGEAEIAEIVTAWTGIPVRKRAEEETTRLLHLEELLGEKVIGQPQAVEIVARAIRRGQAGLRDPRRPIGSFLFCGPTGVGKTELCRALAEVLFGDAEALITLDMSEYMDSHSTAKMIGSPPGYVGYDEGGQLTEKIRRRPYCVLLLDEIEKAHPDVFHILLQILEDGSLTDSQGRRADFRHTVMILTSNLGADGITRRGSSLGFESTAEENGEAKETRIHAYVNNKLREAFRPEFLNRIDEIVVFHPLEIDAIRTIAKLMLKQTSQRAAELGIRLTFEDTVIEKLAREGTDLLYGARPLRRCIRQQLEDPLSTLLLSQTFRSGDHILVTLGEAQKICFQKIENVSDSDVKTQNSPTFD